MWNTILSFTSKYNTVGTRNLLKCTNGTVKLENEYSWGPGYGI
jgi:hypothetical protein